MKSKLKFVDWKKNIMTNKKFIMKEHMKFIKKVENLKKND